MAQPGVTTLENPLQCALIVLIVARLKLLASKARAVKIGQADDVDFLRVERQILKGKLQRRMRKAGKLFLPVKPFLLNGKYQFSVAQNDNRTINSFIDSDDDHTGLLTLTGDTTLRARASSDPKVITNNL